MADEKDSKLEKQVSDFIIKKIALNSEQQAILERKGREASMIADLNFDSLDAIDVVMDFELAYEIKIPDEASEKFVNLGNVIDYIKANGYESSKHEQYEKRLTELSKAKV